MAEKLWCFGMPWICNEENKDFVKRVYEETMRQGMQGGNGPRGKR